MSTRKDTGYYSYLAACRAICSPGRRSGADPCSRTTAPPLMPAEHPWWRNACPSRRKTRYEAKPVRRAAARLKALRGTLPDQGAGAVAAEGASSRQA